MFGSKTKIEPAEPTVIGKGTVVEGTIRVSGPVQVDGQIEGALFADKHVAVGPSGSIHGEVSADELAVGGKIDGRINVRGHLHVAQGGSCSGTVRYGSLQVDRGGVLAGSTLHDEDDAQLDAATSGDNLPKPPPLPSPARA